MNILMDDVEVGVAEEKEGTGEYEVSDCKEVGYVALGK